MTEYCRSACRQSGFEYEDWQTSPRDFASEWQLPLRWVIASTGGLSLISLAIGLTLKWLLQ